MVFNLFDVQSEKCGVLFFYMLPPIEDPMVPSDFRNHQMSKVDNLKSVKVQMFP